ncbi:radical SAM protein [Candidatus Woesearchaeota archaeon]|nr:radical SAM protein [Candidatus Woesearchaeota archaeon]
MATKRRIKKTSYFSYLVGKPAKGCQLCVKGCKTVIFITGLCSQNPRCFFCPISEQKAGKDLVYANEWKIASKKDLITEAKLTKAKGAGITGGDPLVKLDRTVKYIKLLKKTFGKSFHIHLYTPLNLVNKTRLEKLYKAGLDEIRFHPMLDKKNEWKRILLAKKFNWDVGVEIPVIPGKKKETIELIDYIKDKVDFLNLNELEISDTNANKLRQKGFKQKSKLSYAAKGSQELAKTLLKHLQKTKLKVHYCTAKTKDKVQLTRRIKRRALSVARPFDFITPDGTLVRGAIYLKQSVPGFDYKKRMMKLSKRKVLQKLDKLKNRLNVPEKMIELDKIRLRLLTSIAIIDDIKDELKQLNLVPVIIEEYPTHDAMLIDVQFL